MRNTILTLVMMNAVGVSGFAAGRIVQTTTPGPQALNAFETEQSYVVLAKSGTRQQKEGRQQTEGCPVMPNELSRHKSNEQDSSIMKGLVF